MEPGPWILTMDPGPWFLYSWSLDPEAQEIGFLRKIDEQCFDDVFFLISSDTKLEFLFVHL